MASSRSSSRPSFASRATRGRSGSVCRGSVRLAGGGAGPGRADRPPTSPRSYRLSRPAAEHQNLFVEPPLTRLRPSLRAADVAVSSDPKGNVSSHRPLLSSPALGLVRGENWPERPSHALADPWMILLADYKLPHYLDPYEAIEGNNIAGYVEEVGSDVQRLKKGDKVAAFTVMKTHDKYGAYAEYTVRPCFSFRRRRAALEPLPDLVPLPLPSSPDRSRPTTRSSTSAPTRRSRTRRRSRSPTSRPPSASSSASSSSSRARRASATALCSSTAARRPSASMRSSSPRCVALPRFVRRRGREEVPRSGSTTSSRPARRQAPALLPLAHPH